jgi:hypothetical protein
MLDRIHRPAVAGVAGHALTWGLPRKAAAEGGFVQVCRAKPATRR